MTTITFDTHEIIKKLQTAGFTEQQAEAITRTARSASEQGDYATKADLKETEAGLKREILELENRLIKWGVAIALGQAALIATLVKLL